CHRSVDLDFASAAARPAPTVATGAVVPAHPGKRHNSPTMQLPVSLAAFRPRLLDAPPGYDREPFLHDLGAGLTVAVVALPLAMAFAIASGLKPEAGLWTAITARLWVLVAGGSTAPIIG